MDRWHGREWANACFFGDKDDCRIQNGGLHVSSGMTQTLGDVPHPAVRPSFETIYTVGLSFLRQTLRWLGVAEGDLDDVLQDVMLAAYRGLESFDPARAEQVAQG